MVIFIVLDNGTAGPLTKHLYDTHFNLFSKKVQRTNYHFNVYVDILGLIVIRYKFVFAVIYKHSNVN